MDRWKAELGRGREKRRVEERQIREEKDSEERRCRGRNSAKHCVFPMIWGSGGSKSRLAKVAGAEPSGQMRDEKCTPLWREAHFEVKMYKAPQLRSTFRGCDIEKVHAVVARSAFRSQNVQNASCSDHFLEVQNVVTRGGRKGLCHLVESEQNVRACSISKNHGRHGTFEEDLQRCIFPWQAQYKRHVHERC